jgi:SAM-dependent methyltransferase
VRPDEICAWFGKARQPTVDETRVAQLYFTFHPRTAFLKTLGPAAEVVDIGAGDGSLAVFRSWPQPAREDLKMYAYSIEKGRYFDDFSGYEISDWNASRPDFGGKCFDAIVCAHFIEHIQDPASLVVWAASKLRKRGRIYLEWPSANSLSLPSRKELEELGVPLIISRFDDDDTHQVLPDGDAIVEAMRDSGFTIESRGIVRLPWLEDEMLAHFKDSADGFYRQAAFWSHTGWCQYVVAELRGDPEGSGSVHPPQMRGTPGAGRPSEMQVGTLRHSFAALQAAQKDSLSRVRNLEAALAEAQESLAEERQRLDADMAQERHGMDELEAICRRQSAELEDMRRRHEQVLGSRSWKLTEPLRALARLLRRH